MRHTPIVKTIHWPDEHATERLAQRLAGVPELRDCLITLHGDLGAGKTTFVRHLLRACGVKGRIKSPTYALVEAYELNDWAAWHFDFYRFQNPQEWADAGFRDIFSSTGLKLAEWPEKVGALLPQADLEMHLSTQDDAQRRVELVAASARGRALLEAAGCDASP